MIRRSTCLKWAALAGASAVALGAFGAHALADILDARMTEVWRTAVRYHLVHAVALLALGAGEGLWRNRWCGRAAVAWLVGIVVFPGSLYLLSLSGIGALGALTPLGGAALIGGWICLLPVGVSLAREDSPDVGIRPRIGPD